MAKKRTEWQEIVDVHSIELFRTDVIELINLLSACEDFERPKIEMSVTSDSRTIKFDPVNEDFNDFGIDKSNQISIVLYIWRDVANENGNSDYKQQEIVSCIKMDMQVNYVNYQIHSNSEIWFMGKKEQLTKFFESRRPAVAKKSNNYKVFRLINNIIFFLAFALVFFFLLNKEYLFTIIPSIVVILTSIIPIRKSELKSPSFVMVNFHDRPTEEIAQKKEIPWILIVNILALTVAIISLFMK